CTKSVYFISASVLFLISLLYTVTSSPSLYTLSLHDALPILVRLLYYENHTLLVFLHNQLIPLLFHHPAQIELLPPQEHSVFCHRSLHAGILMHHSLHKSDNASRFVSVCRRY